MIEDPKKMNGQEEPDQNADHSDHAATGRHGEDNHTMPAIRNLSTQNPPAHGPAAAHDAHPMKEEHAPSPDGSTEQAEHAPNPSRNTPTGPGMGLKRRW